MPRVAQLDRKWRGHLDDYVTAIAWSPDNQQVAVCDGAGTVQCLNPITRQTHCLQNSEGQSIMSQHPQKRNLELASCILSHKVFNESLRIYLDRAKPPISKDIVRIMKEDSPRNANYSNEVLKRRAQTVKGWIEWILELTV